MNIYITSPLIKYLNDNKRKALAKYSLLISILNHANQGRGWINVEESAEFVCYLSDGAIKPKTFRNNITKLVKANFGFYTDNKKVYNCYSFDNILGLNFNEHSSEQVGIPLVDLLPAVLMNGYFEVSAILHDLLIKANESSKSGKLTASRETLENMGAKSRQTQRRYEAVLEVFKTIANYDIIGLDTPHLRRQLISEGISFGVSKDWKNILKLGKNTIVLVRRLPNSYKSDKLKRNRKKFDEKKVALNTQNGMKSFAKFCHQIFNFVSPKNSGINCKMIRDNFSLFSSNYKDLDYEYMFTT